MRCNSKIASLLLGCLILAACGFQLRGPDAAPEALSPLALDCGDNIPSGLCAGVRRQLSAYNLLAEEDVEPEYRLELRDYRQQRRVSAITARAAAAEYELTTDMKISLITRDDIPLLGRASVQATEVYRTDETRVLAEEGERSTVERALYSRLVRQVISRLQPFDEERILMVRQQHQAKP